jgi:hypothetical protein
MKQGESHEEYLVQIQGLAQRWLLVSLLSVISRGTFSGLTSEPGFPFAVLSVRYLPLA